MPAALAVAVPPLLMTSVPARGAQAAALPPGGPAKLVNRNSSKRADVEGRSKDDGGNVRQWSCRDQDNSSRQWRSFTATQTTPGSRRALSDACATIGA